MNKTIGRVLFKTDYEFFDEEHNYISTIAYLEGAGEVTMLSGNQVFMIVKEGGWLKRFNLHEIDSGTKRAAKKIASLSSVDQNPTVARVEFGDKSIAFANNSKFGFFGFMYFFNKINLSIVESGRETGKVTQEGDKFIFQYWGNAPREIQTFLYWGLLYGLYRPRSTS